MTCCSLKSMQSFACPPAGSVLDERQFAGGRSVRDRPAAEPRFGFLRWLSLRRTRLTWLEPERLSEHRLRDLGFLDGRGVQPRDPLRD